MEVPHFFTIRAFFQLNHGFFNESMVPFKSARQAGSNGTIIPRNESFYGRFLGTIILLSKEQGG